MDKHIVETYNTYIAAKVQLLHEDEYVMGTVARRKQDREGNLVGKPNQSPS